MENSIIMALSPLAGGGGASSSKRHVKKPSLTKGLTKSIDKAQAPVRHERSEEVVETYFGADGRPIKRKSVGAARISRRYDERGNQIEEAYFNVEGKPTRRKDIGAARIAWRYDESGRKIEAEFFGPDGALLSTQIADKARTQATRDAF